MPKPGPRVFLNYSKNDEWAVGMIAHELLSKEGAEPFRDMEHPATYSDAGFQQGSIPKRCRPLASRLLRLKLEDRLGAAEGARLAKALLAGGSGAQP